MPLVLLYLLRVRRYERRVSPLFRRLQRDPLLVLQLLALLALATASVRPSVTLLGEGARTVVVVLDTSASMKARDVLPSRFAEAQALAAAPVHRLGWRLSGRDGAAQR